MRDAFVGTFSYNLLRISTMDRRPLKTRGASWAKNLAASLAQLGLTPNLISLLSVVFAFLVLFAGSLAKSNPSYFLICAGLIQLRLLCNLLDGMVAVEHGKSSANGELFNDVPDRFADIFIIVGASFSIVDDGYVISPLNLAWIASSLAVITAYIRVLGKSLGTSSYFIGPMAKQHRMFLLTLALIIEFFLIGSSFSTKILYIALVIIASGSLVTTFRRLRIISSDLLKGDLK